MDVMLVSRRGAMFKYFRLISARLDLYTRVFDFSLKLYLWPKNLDLSDDEISQGIAFHLQRKRAKHNFPFWFWLLLERYYKFKYKNIFRRFYTLIKHHEPRCIGIFNGHRLPEQAIRNIASKLSIPIIYFENGLLPNTTTFDLKGINAENSIPREVEFYRNYSYSSPSKNSNERKLVQRQFHRFKKLHSLKSKFHKDLPKKFIFVPFQVHFDSQVLCNSPYIKTMRELYDWIECAAFNCDDPDLQFVIKEHPSDPHRYGDLYNKNQRIVFSNRNTSELIEKSKAVVTLNSSVGMEALFLNKRLIVLGLACYAIDEIAKAVTSKAQLVEELNNLKSWQSNLPMIEKFIAYLQNDYCIPQTWRSPNEEHISAIQSRFKVIINNTSVTKSMSENSPMGAY